MTIVAYKAHYDNCLLRFRDGPLFCKNDTYRAKPAFDTYVTLLVLSACTPTSALGFRADQSRLEVKCDMHAGIGHSVRSYD
jgi:hypothetical protein